MDVLDYKENNYLGYVKADTEGWLAEQEALELAAQGKTGLEDKGTAPKVQQPDSNVFSTITGLFSKGLDLGLQLTRPQGAAPMPTTPPEEEKIMGMPKPVFYGGLAVAGLVAAVIVVKKMRN